ncbi:MAG: hypothetical protein ABSG15_09565 [FCB group bacterium]|jgi:hypothetical protein
MNPVRFKKIFILSLSLSFLFFIFSACQHAPFLYKFELSTDKTHYIQEDTIKFIGKITNIGTESFYFYYNPNYLFLKPDDLWLLLFDDYLHQHHTSHCLGHVFNPGGLNSSEYIGISPGEIIDLNFKLNFEKLVKSKCLQDLGSDLSGKYNFCIYYHDYYKNHFYSIDSMRSNEIEVYIDYKDK